MLPHAKRRVLCTFFVLATLPVHADCTYLEAIARESGRRWNATRRLLIGEDIGIYGGAFKITDGFIDRFAPEPALILRFGSAIVGAGVRRSA